MNITNDMCKSFEDCGFEEDLGEVVEWIESALTPEDVFDRSILNEWAIYNGFVYNPD